MSQPPLKIGGADLGAILPHVALPAPAKTAIEGVVDAPSALARLEQGGFLLEASRFLAHALPRREAVWWACMCARHTEPRELPEADRRARAAAESWVREQTDAQRRQAMAEAQAGGCATPEAWAGVAAFWSGDSMAPPDQPKVPPMPHLAGLAVAGAVALASVRGSPARQPERLRRFLESGRSIATGGTGRLPPEET